MSGIPVTKVVEKPESRRPKFDLYRTMEIIANTKLIIVEIAGFIGFCWLVVHVVRLECGF